MKQRKLFLFACSIIALCLMTGCSSANEAGMNGAPNEGEGDVPTGNHIELTSEEQEMVNSTNDFAFQLLATENDIEEGRSFAISPLSAGYLLAMLYEGAQGQTQQEIKQVFGFNDATPAEVSAFFKKILTLSPAIDSKVKLYVANALFGNSQHQVEFAIDYSATMKNSYLAQAQCLDFSTPTALKTINQWCDSHTQGTIPEIMSQQEFSSDAIAYLLNSVYFKAPWSSAFNKENTREGLFATIRGEQCKVDMMNQKVMVGYAIDNDLKAINLPYGDGSYVMAVVMPVNEKELSIAGLSKKLTANRWEQTAKTLANNQLVMDVTIPRFQMDSKTDLKTPLQSMGMVKAFSYTDADFSPMLKKKTDLYISKMIQKTRIDVDEDGAEAASVSEAEMSLGADGEGDDSNVFKANRPFIYLIFEKATNAIFFIGEYTGKQ